MKVLAFNCSSRKNGNTAILIHHVFDGLQQENIKTELIQLGDKTLNQCKACYACFHMKNNRCVIEDEMNDYIALIKEANGLIIGSPVYVAGATANMYSLISRVGLVAIANNRFLQNKVGAAVIAMRRAGGVNVFNQINHFFLAEGMIVPGSTYWNLGIGREIGEVNNDSEGINNVKDLGKKMAWLLKKIND